MIYKEVTIINSLGLHARAAAKLVDQCRQLSCEIKVGHNLNNMGNANSIMKLLKLQAIKGTPLIVSAHGRDELIAIEAICKLIDSGFHEE